MIKFILPWLVHLWWGFYVFDYIFVRIVCAAIMGACIVLLFGKSFIFYLHKHQLGEIIRIEGPKRHYAKQGTPTMGGLLLVFSILVTTLIWVDLTNVFVWMVLFILLTFAILGFIDDYSKLMSQKKKTVVRGLRMRVKLFWQTLLAVFVIVCVYFYFHTWFESLSIQIPIIWRFVIPIGFTLFLILGWFVIVGASNSVNLTDGLDGLASMPIALVSAGLGVFAYVGGHALLSEYFMVQYIPGISELSVICASLSGVMVGFLWYNCHPAEIFMGDVGSLSLGAVLGCIAVMVRQEILFFILSFIFVIEAISVMIQVIYFKCTKGKRFFLMAPLHHHFEKKGLAEPKIVVRAWIISVLCLFLSVAALICRL